MHIPRKFNQPELTSLLDVIAEFPFATLIANTAEGIQAHHLPFILDPQSLTSDDSDFQLEQSVLRGHIARVNTLWRELEEGADVTLVFNGPSCYISPDYYPTKKEHGKAVPTWNYVVVHVCGKISFVHDAEWNLEMLNLLTDQHESGRATPWSVADAPQNYTEKMLSAIVGIKIEVTAISGQWKLSQNQPEQNRNGVVEGLLAEKDPRAHAVAELVRKHAPQVSE